MNTAYEKFILAFDGLPIIYVDIPSPGMAVPNSAMVLAPDQAKMPPTSHTTSAIPGEGTFVSIDPGDVNIPLPMTMLMMIANAFSVPKLRANVPSP